MGLRIGRIPDYIRATNTPGRSPDEIRGWAFASAESRIASGLQIRRLVARMKSGGWAFASAESRIASGLQIPGDDLCDDEADDKAQAQVDQYLQKPVRPPLLHQQGLDQTLLGGRLGLQRLVQQARQFRQQLHVARSLVLQALDEAAPADLVVHPALEEGLGGVPQ